MQLEMQVNTLESANLNAETMTAMKNAASVLQQIHSGMCVHVVGSVAWADTSRFRRSVQKVDETMAAINEQREVANEIADLISNPTGVDSLADVGPRFMHGS